MTSQWNCNYIAPSTESVINYTFPVTIYSKKSSGIAFYFNGFVTPRGFELKTFVSFK